VTKGSKGRGCGYGSALVCIEKVWRQVRGLIFGDEQTQDLLSDAGYKAAKQENSRGIRLGGGFREAAASGNSSLGNERHIMSAGTRSGLN